MRLNLKNNSKDGFREKLKKFLGIEPVPKPHIGMRIVKTGLSMFVILIIYEMIGRQRSWAILAMLGALMAMEDTMEHSLKTGIARLLGTAVGGIIGLCFFALAMILPVQQNLIVYAFYVGAATVIGISTCVWLGLRDVTRISTVMVLIILVNDQLGSTFSYALSRILDTAVGVVVAIIINITIRPPNWK